MVKVGRFPDAARLRKGRQFRYVFERPERSADQFFTVFARPNGLRHPRLGLAISKKVARRAVERNRIKRIARESFRQSHEALPNSDLVVMARPRAAHQANLALFASLQSHWVRLAKRRALRGKLTSAAAHPV